KAQPARNTGIFNEICGGQQTTCPAQLERFRWEVKIASHLGQAQRVRALFPFTGFLICGAVVGLLGGDTSGSRRQRVALRLKSCSRQANTVLGFNPKITVSPGMVLNRIRYLLK